MRPGRLDRILFVGPPDKIGREEILKIRTKIMTVGPDLDIENIAEIVSFTKFYLRSLSLVD
jgi:AAA family ATPase